MQGVGRRRCAIKKLAGGLIRRLASSQPAEQHKIHSGYVTSMSAGLISPMLPQAAPIGDPVAHPEPFSRFIFGQKTELLASFEDILVVDKAFRLFITSPTRFPRRWKLLPNYGNLIRSFPGPVCVARWNDQLLLLVTPAGNENSLLYSFQTNSWIICDKPHQPPSHRLFPGFSASSDLPAWFHGSFYISCRMELAAFDPKTPGNSDDEDEDQDVLFSMMRFDPTERRWHQLEFSDGDAELLTSGKPTPLVLRGQLLVFSVAWRYLHEESMECFVSDERAEALWDGRSNPFKVFRLEDDPSRQGWSEASESKRRNMKKLVDVSGEFRKLLDTAWTRRAGRFFTGDDDQVLFWLTYDSTVERYDVSSDGPLGSPGSFFWSALEPKLVSRVQPSSLVMFHRDPCGDGSVFSLFEGLPEINDSTSDEELRKLLPYADFREKNSVATVQAAYQHQHINTTMHLNLESSL